MEDRKRRSESGGERVQKYARRSLSPALCGKVEFNDNGAFEGLPDELVVLVLAKVFAGASSSSDVANVALTCRRFCTLGADPQVLAQASPGVLSFPAKNWSCSAHGFLQMCALSGNVEALYLLGMIRFYCLGDWWVGASLLAKAAFKGHGDAMYALAIIHFNGSGGTRQDRNVQAGVSLCRRGAQLGCITALKELGHCCQDGYGTPRNIAEGRRYIMQANAADLLNHLNQSGARASEDLKNMLRHIASSSPALLKTDKKEASATPLQPVADGKPSIALAPPLPYSLASRASTLQSQLQQQAATTIKEQQQVGTTVNEDTPARGGEPPPRTQCVPLQQLQAFPNKNLKLVTCRQPACQHGISHRHDECPGPGRHLCLILQNNSLPSTAEDPCTPLKSIHQFLIDWFSIHLLEGGLQLCGNARCGRPETRLHEFRCCMPCGKAKYCSRTCQVADWKVRHRFFCGVPPHFLAVNRQ